MVPAAPRPPAFRRFAVRSSDEIRYGARCLTGGTPPGLCGRRCRPGQLLLPAPPARAAITWRLAPLRRRGVPWSE